MRRKLLALILSLTLCAASFSGCGSKTEKAGTGSTGDGTADTKDMYTVTMAYIGNDQPDLPKVEAAMNKILAKDLGVQIDILPLSWGSYQQQLQLMLSGDEKLDLVPVLLNNANSYISSGQVIDMSELIDKYGTNIKKSLGEENTKISNVGGYVFGVPVEKEWYTDTCLLMRKDLVNKYKIDVSKITSLAAAESAFAAVKAGEPDMKILVGSKDSGVLGQIGHSDVLLDGFGVLENGGQTTTVKNVYETETYLDLARTIHKFYEKGYVDKDMPTTTDSVQTIMKSGNAFAYASPYKPGVVEQDSLATGYDLVAAKIQPVPAYCTENGTCFVSWGIAKNSSDPEKAMQLLDYLYGSADIMNLFNWGIEGEHYVYADKDNDVIGFPDGIDSSNTKYNLNLGWELPNQYAIHVWKGSSKKIMEEQKEMNQTAMKSKAFGFVYDYSNLSNELTALSNITSEYSSSINSGAVDPDVVIPELNKKLYDAGLQKVIDEKQKQLDEWLAKQK